MHTTSICCFTHKASKAKNSCRLVIYKLKNEHVIKGIWTLGKGVLY